MQLEEGLAVFNSISLVLISTYGWDKRRFQTEEEVLLFGRTRRPSPSCWWTF